MDRFFRWVESYNSRGSISARTPVSFLVGIIIVTLALLLLTYVYKFWIQYTPDALVATALTIPGIGMALGFVWLIGATFLEWSSNVWQNIKDSSNA